MKKTITFIFCIIYAFAAKSQENCHTLDSMISYNYRILDDGFDSIPYGKELYSYDSTGNTISEVTYYYEKFTEELQYSWKEYDSLVHTYDSFNNQILQLHYFWAYSLNDWLGFLKYEYKYDSRNNLIFYQRSFWDYNNNVWDLEEKKEYEFDENNNRISYEIYRNVDSVEQQPLWRLYEKEEDFYNEENKIINHIEFEYDPDSIKLFATKKVDYSYNSFNLHDTVVVSLKDEDSAALVNYRKTIYEYNEKGTLISEKEYSWSLQNSEWREFSTNFYDSEGKLIQTVNSNYKSEYEYDAAGNLILQTNYKLNVGTNEWDKNSYCTKKYNYYNNILLDEYFTKDSETDKFILSNKWEQEYDFAGQLIYKGLYVAYPFLHTPSIYKYEGYFYYFSYNSEIIEGKETICQGDSIFWQGNHYKTPGTFHSINNCDSIYLLNLDVTEKPDVLEIYGDTSVNTDNNFIYSVPYDSTLEYNWIVENGDILSQPTDSTVEILWETGAGKVLLFTTDKKGCTSDTSTFDVGVSVGKSFNLLSNQIEVFPNPAKSSFTIRFAEQFVDKGFSIRIMDYLGEIIYTSGVINKEIKLDTSELKGQGVCFINLIDRKGNTVSSYKLVLL